MRILAVDTANAYCSVVLADGDSILFSYTEPDPSCQAERLVPLMEEALEKAGCAYGDLDRLGVTIGPGSFTGVRIGLAAMQGIHLVTNVPLVGVSTLSVLAREAASHIKDDTTQQIVALQDAHRGQYYLQCFSKAGDALGKPCCVYPDDVANALPEVPYIAIGNVEEDSINHIQPIDRPGLVGLTALIQQVQSEAGQRGQITPLYIRPPDAKKMAMSPIARLAAQAAGALS